MDKEECVAMELAAGDGFRQVGTHAYLLILYVCFCRVDIVSTSGCYGHSVALFFCVFCLCDKN